MRVARACAKINLTLAVTGRRADGYHLLDSLVGFARDVYDDVEFTPASALSLTVDGPLAAAAGETDNNLIMFAARAFAERVDKARLGAFHLTKRLPAAAGIGGGSADAGAALRLLAAANDLASDDPAVMAAARATGADVSVCVASRARVMRGVGDELGDVLAPLALRAVLVNPGVACPTPAVFRALDHQAHSPPRSLTKPSFSARAELIGWLASQANDLESPAIRIAPQINEVLTALRDCEDCRVARMSGSGATCFGLFSDADSAARAHYKVRAQRPDWWVAASVID